MKQIISSLLQICLLTFSYLYTTTKVTLAQITPDNTVNTRVERSGNVSEITGGATRGNNLFHSFEQFSIPGGNEAFFNNANAIQNIFSRVTGGSISEINGLIRANGGANLFLINPAGIIFGENASLKLGGSFYGSTANSIIFPDGEFSATASGAEPILTISVPIGLSFEDNPEPIINRSVAGLEVSVGENIFLVGGDVNFPGGKIFAPGGEVELGGLAAAGEININANGNLSFPDDIEKADVTLSNAGEVNVLSGGGGSITVNARNLDLSGSALQAGIAIDSGSLDTQAGDITLNVTDAIDLSQGSVIFNQVYPTGVGNGGKINITTTNLFLTEGSTLSTSTAGQGNGGELNITTANFSLDSGSQIVASTFGIGDVGTISINSSESVTLDRGSTIINKVEVGAVGNGKHLSITTPSLILTNGGQIISGTNGEGNGGDITLTTFELIVDGTSNDGFKSAIVNEVQEEAIGNSGELNISTPNLALTNGGTISSRTIGQGNGGELNISTSSLTLANGNIIVAGTFGQGNGSTISINATESVTIDGTDTKGYRSGIVNRVEEDATGNAGELNITTPKLALTDGGAISISTFGQGNGGTISINASESITIDGVGAIGDDFSAIFNTVEDDAVGNGGELNITTPNLALTNGGQIVASTFGQGNGGNISINATELVTIDGRAADGSNYSAIFNTVEDNAVGNGGELNITTPNLALTNGGQIIASSFGRGDGGSIFVIANDLSIDEGKISAENIPSRLIAANEPIRTGGNVTLKIANRLTLRNNSEISAEAGSNATGGNLDIDAEFIVAFPNQNNDLIAIADRGTGGNISITSEGVFGLAKRSSIPENNTNDLDASSQLGIDGTVQINAPDVNLQKELEQLEGELVSAESAIANSCLTRTNQQGSFTVGGGDRLPKSPDSNYSDVNFSLTGIGSLPPVVKPVPTQSNYWQHSTPIPAAKMVTTEDGRIFLVAAPEKAESLFCQS